MKLPYRLLCTAFFAIAPAIAFAVQPLEMDNAVVLESSDPAVLDQLVITGHNFNNGGAVNLTLGGTPLSVILQEENRIIAEIPADVLPGSYVLAAWSGNGSVREDSMDVTIGAEGPAGPQGEVGPAGQDGAPGADGAPGQDGAPGADGSSCSAADTLDGALISCTDGTSATVFDGTDGVNGLPGVKGDAGDAGPPGPQGPPGNLALAGLSCSSGTFLIGFSDTGTLVCASVDSNGGGTTPPPVGDAEIVFVATAASGGADTNPGTRSLPLSTIQAGIDKAVETGLSRVNVAAGTYTSASTIQLANGVSVVGGFDVTDWMQHGNPTVITVSAPIALRAQDIEAKTILDSLVLSSADGQANQSSYGVYARASNGLEIRNSTITAGTGGAGLDGISVSSGIAGNTGGAGGNGSPDGPHGSGGSGGSGSCGAGSGGSGGRGALEGSTAAGQSGFNGNSGSGGSSGGIGGSGGATGDCGFGISCRGRAGEAGSNGQGGSAGQNGMSASNGLGTIVAGLWVGQNGSSGSTGRPGSGGGGGGGGGGQIGALINDGGGNGGGGGGAGGCGGEGGSGGFAGGGSFGIFLVDSTGVEIHDNLVTSGGGGMGGSGGAGGTGGTGGAGGPGANNATDEIGAGGAGGNGGTGGRGGQGGGGAGGVSFSIGLSNSTIVESGNQLLFGAGGTGGAAAGNAGIAGANGMIQNF